KPSYRKRNVIERLFGWLKSCRRIATRYDKLATRRLASRQCSRLLASVDASGITFRTKRNMARWDAEAAREVLRAYVVEALGDAEAVLIVDETGFLKKGTHSVGVQRQYSGTAGRVENSQVGVFLCYACRHGAAFIDRALYLPKCWVNDPARCAEAGVPEQARRFQTKPALARTMLERALDAGVPCGWVTGDAVYGKDRKPRLWLEACQQPFVLAVAGNEPVWFDGPQTHRVAALAKALPETAWQRHAVGAGSKGARTFEWAWVPLWRLQLSAEERTWGHWLVVRRNCNRPEERAYYIAFAPRAEATLERLAKVAGQRWAIEVGFELAKQQCGLDEYEVRRWPAWHRHITLALLAHACLVVLQRRAKKGALSPGGSH
ncbi:SRSO17 transposase, partial [Marichromatium gracile]